MTIRSASAALLALGLGGSVAPADAQQIGASNVQGHAYWVPGQQAIGLVRSAGRSQDVVSTGSIDGPLRYTSAGGQGVDTRDATQQVGRTINVWGARIDAPVQLR
ncbi:hypothetical protein [Methylobacterium nigriterrae]|uniref:hypothetical protein n=1 Tax=Methylobacterium nigriterrae TaxID=3127512 RepID=UPI003013F7DE